MSEANFEHHLDALRNLFRDENDRGGDARGTVRGIARLVGLDMAQDIPEGGMWGWRNMHRVHLAVQRRINELETAVERQVAASR